MSPNTKTGEVVGDFQRYLKTGDRSIIDTYSLAELRLADEQHGSSGIDAGFRVALQNSIKELEEENLSQHQSKVRVIGYVIAIVLLIILVVPYLA
jgi:hypothetical protein